MMGVDLGDGVWRLSAIRLQQLLGLSPQLIDIGGLAHRASVRASPVSGHDELLSRPCPWHGHPRPLSALRAGKEIILATTRSMSGWTQSFPRTWVTPRCASASIPRRSRRSPHRRGRHVQRPRFRTPTDSFGCLPSVTTVESAHLVRDGFRNVLENGPAPRYSDPPLTRACCRADFTVECRPQNDFTCRLLF